MADNYDVTDITRTVFKVPGQLAGPALEVAFVTKPSGIASSVIIPADKFNTAEVHRAASAQAGELEAVKAL